MKKKRICLDPGHYGKRYNAGAVAGYYESLVMWNLTMMEKEFLEKMGIEVVLTRKNINEDLDLTARGKQAAGCDLFVSNHTNACGTPSVRRVVSIYLTERNGTDIDDKSRIFASKIAQVVDKSMGGVGHQTYSKLSDNDRDGNGKKDDNYYGVLNGAFLAGVPGVIIEHSFHTNAETCKWLMDSKNLRKLAEDCAKCMAAQVGVVETDDDDDIDAVDFKEFTREEILEQIGDLLTEDQRKSGILASVSGAQLILESSGLQSELAQNANNCFGMKEKLSGNTWSGSVWDGSVYTKKTSEWDGDKYIEIIANFRKYPNIADSIADHSAYLLGAMNGDKKRYAGLAGCTDHRKALQIIKNGGYATAPDYVEKLLNVIEKYDLKQFDLPIESKTETPKVETPSEEVTYPDVPFTVQVIIDDLYYRAEPSMNGDIKGKTRKGVFTIVQVSNGWGKLKSGAGWIWLGEPEYCVIQKTVETVNPVVPFKVKIDIINLNIRIGAGDNYPKTGKVTGKGVFTIVEVKNGSGSKTGWGKLKSGAGWISLDYTKRI